MQNPAPIDFYFEFTSPYSYIASEWIEALAARRKDLEAQLDKLPKDEEQSKQAASAILGDYRALEHRVHREATQIKSIKAQLAAIDVWLGDNRNGLTKEQVDLIKSRLLESRAEVLALEGENEQLSSDARTQSTLVEGDQGRGHANNRSCGQRVQPSIRAAACLWRARARARDGWRRRRPSPSGEHRLRWQSLPGRRRCGRRRGPGRAGAP